MWNFELYYPTKILFGAGVSKKAGEVIASQGIGRVLVVTDKGVSEVGVLDGILPVLDGAGLVYEVFSEVGHESTLRQIHRGLDVQNDFGGEVILSVGGGSVMDTAKGIGCLATNPGPLRDYEGAEKYFIPPVPTIAIPTTAGTGSEVSFGAVAFDEEGEYKFSFRNSMQIPRTAFLDPELLATTPPALAAAAGLDALSHAVEAFVSRVANGFTDAYCIQNFRLVGKYLRRFVADPADTEAASGMLIASSMGSTAFNVARLGLIHAMAHPLGTHFHLPHGAACAVLMPHVIKFNLMSCPDRYRDMTFCLEGIPDADGLSGKEYSALNAVERLMHDISVEIDLSAHDVTDEMLSKLADETLSSGMQLTNPRDADKKDVMGIFRNLFS
jgi:alcohol dehydrogenase class IV